MGNPIPRSIIQIGTSNYATDYSRLYEALEAFAFDKVPEKFDGHLCINASNNFG